MRAKTKNQIISLLLGTILGASAAPVLIPNGDFSDPAGPMTLWVPLTEGPEFFFDFNENGGASGVDPDGHAVIDNIGTVGYGLLAANGNQVISLSSLGLVAGGSYTFSQAMRFDPIEGGGTNQMGGLKIDFFVGNTFLCSTGDLYPELIGDGTTWENYRFDLNIPPAADGCKVLLLWGQNSGVSFDNVQVESVPLPPITSIPNGDFATVEGDSWGQNNDGGAAVISYPTTGGNGDNGGYAEIDATNANFGVIISHSDGVLPIAGLGLTAGESYHFKQDMRIISGSNIGGLKVEYFSCGQQHSTTGNLCPVSNSGSAWATYTFPLQIPPNADGIKLVVLSGERSKVGYDNFTIETTPLSAPAIVNIPNGDFSEGRKNWDTAGNADTVFTFPGTGGNGGGYALLTRNSNPSGFGVLVANAASSIPLERLGLVAGEAYTFRMDTYRDSGADTAKLKIEYYRRGVSLGSSGDLDGSTLAGVWTTDDFVVTLPIGTDAIRVVPIAGFDSAIRFDNISVDPTPIAESPAVPNLDFEQGGAGWAAFGQPDTAFTFPGAQGNPDGYGLMSNNGNGFGVLVANAGNIIPLASLGLSPDNFIDLKIDLKLFSGPNIGGVKIEYYSGAAGGFATGDQTADSFPIAINGGADWETYTFDNLFVPATINAGGAVDGIKIVLLWGSGSNVGFDNVEVLTPEPTTTITITDSGFDTSGNFYLDIAEGVTGLRVMSSPSLAANSFVLATGVSDDGLNRFTINATSLDSNGDGADFFRVEEVPD